VEVKKELERKVKHLEMTIQEKELKEAHSEGVIGELRTQVRQLREDIRDIASQQRFHFKGKGKGKDDDSQRNEEQGAKGEKGDKGGGKGKNGP